METKYYIFGGFGVVIILYFVSKQIMILDWSEQFLLFFGAFFIGLMGVIYYFMRKEYEVGLQ